MHGKLKEAVRVERRVSREDSAEGGASPGMPIFSIGSTMPECEIIILTGLQR